MNRDTHADFSGVASIAITLLGFAFAHGMNGLRQVLFEYIHSPKARRTLSVTLLVVWFAIMLIGALALIFGVRQP